MRALLALLLVLLALSGCASEPGSGTTETTRTVKEKYEQGGAYYLSVTGPSDSIVQVEIREQEVWEEIKTGETVTFDRDWHVVRIEGREISG
ncbi:hypothetical protein [Cohnella sp. AR92]|uniref:hypothetical protein n=1 Tax=Cohnella sp. AR92 TaxID=648716 RepID=UPI000F8E114B|nr:hypothetical protein [Cohnella sp. AR92]RUS49105.1 hypothetical protein ELR57_01835 [Cohnella sp. AR92]